MTYDDDGNLTSDGTATYGWTARGDLKQVSRTGLAASFGYDALGDRSTRTVNGTSTGFLNDGANTSAELDSANAIASSLLSGGVDQWFARTKAGATDAVLTDAQGSPVALGQADGTMGATYGYAPTAPRPRPETRAAVTCPTRASRVNSFVAGTEAVMADGTRKQIEEVKFGDQVMATDTATGRLAAKSVTDPITGSGQKNLVSLH